MHDYRPTLLFSTCITIEEFTGQILNVRTTVAVIGVGILEEVVALWITIASYRIHEVLTVSTTDHLVCWCKQVWDKDQKALMRGSEKFDYYYNRQLHFLVMKVDNDNSGIFACFPYLNIGRRTVSDIFSSLISGLASARQNWVLQKMWSTICTEGPPNVRLT